MLQRRIIALVVMALVSTSTPAVYQIGVEPRLQGANCDISITSLRMDEEHNKQGEVSFRAYLRIENPSPVDVILSKLDLDVYHHSAAVGRYQKIGTLKTEREYQIGHGKDDNFIYTYIDPEGNMDTYNPADMDTEVVVANLTFAEDSIGGHATTEAIGNLISFGYLSVMLKGSALVGPFSFDYERYQTLTVDFWDPNFVIEDIFPFYDIDGKDITYEPHYDGTGIIEDEVGQYIVHAKMHNPSGIPMVIRDFNLSLVDSNDQVRAYGLSLNQEVLSGAYDPDIIDKEHSDNLRIVLNKPYNDGETDIELPSNPNEWVDIFFGFNFTDPYEINPTNVLSKTRDNLQWFFNQLITKSSLEKMRLRGRLEMVMGSLDGANYKGIEVFIGDDDPEVSKFNINHVNMHQLHYPSYDGQNPTSIQELMVTENVVVDSVTVNTQTNDITFDMSSVMNITNPYRMEMQFTDLTTNYYRVDKSNPDSYALQSYFGETSEPDLRTLTIGRADMNSTLSDNGILGPIIPTTTQIPHNFSMTFNTDDFIGNTGISDILQDLQINPQVVNWSNPFGLMSPDVMNVDPLVIMKNLISNGLDPVMLLNKSTVTKYVHNGGDAYFPLNAMFFGSEDHPSGDRSEESIHMSKMQGYAEEIVRGIVATPHRIYDTWDGVYEDPKTQWDIAAVHPSQPEWEWDPNFYITALQDFQGVIITNLGRQGITPAELYDDEYTDNYWWRIYGEPSGSAISDNYPFGYYYDYNEELRDYYAVFHSGINSFLNPGVAFLQNFTLMDDRVTIPQNNAPQNLVSSDVLQATLSISYRYPSGDKAAFGRLGIGVYNERGTPDIVNPDYVYDYSVTPNVDLLEKVYASTTTLWGAPLTNPDGSTEWLSLKLDVTDIIRGQLDAYASSGNKHDLQMEVCFGTQEDVEGTMYFDDIVLKIDYVETTPNSPFEITELFKYTEEKNSIDGNMWNLMGDTGFNATKFISFLGNDLDFGLNGMDNPDVVSFFETTDVSLSDMSYLMTQEPTSFGASETTNFFEMLNDSRYIIPKPYSTAQRTEIEGLGFRDELDNLWVIEDPYKASRAISEIMASKIHTDEYGTIKAPNTIYGEELWMMFDNLQVYMPWIIMYLYSKGWSKNDIFDMLEALGFASETKANYDSHRAQGELSVDMQITGHMNILGNIIQDRVYMSFGMGQTVSDGYQELFRYLFDGTPTISMHFFGGDDVDQSRPLVQSSGSFSNALPWVGDADGEILGFISITVTVTLIPQGFALDIWMQDLRPDAGAAPNNVDTSVNPYLEDQNTEGDASGLNDIGSKLMSTLVRTNYKFAGESFISSGGDPIALFSFLDDYFFTQMDVKSPTGQDYTCDYSSYTLLDHFNVKSTDFIDLITGYNWLDDDFDGNANGKADDWRPKEDLVINGGHGDGVYDLDGPTPTKANWGGWGTNFWDQRIFWHPSDDYDENNGAIMWSDSPDLLYISTENNERDLAHKQGEVYLGGGEVTEIDDPTEGAPPIVNLIDMLLWLSKTTGNFDANLWFDWLIGELGWEYYTIVNSENPLGSIYTGSDSYGPGLYDLGIGLQNVWGMLQNSTFNITGMFNWFENVKNANPWELMWELDNFDVSHGDGNDAPDPQNLLFFALNPNLIMTPDGRVKAAFHDSLGGTLGESKQFLWQLYNASYWDTKGYDIWDYVNDPEGTFPYKLFERFRYIELRDNDLDFNIFNMFMNLFIDPEDWWNSIQYDNIAPIAPLNVLYASDKLNITKLLEAAKNAGLSSKIKINGTFNLGIYGLELTSNGGWEDNTINYLIAPVLFTAAYHWAEFIDPYNLYRSSFTII